MVEEQLGGWLQTVKVYVVEGPREYGAVLVDWRPLEEAEMQQEGQLHEWELERELNLKEEVKVHLNCTHFEQVQHCTDQPLQVTFRRT